MLASGRNWLHSAGTAKARSVEWLRANRDWVVLVLLGVLASWVVIQLFGPGFMTRDSRTQLAQARAFAFEDNHPPVMALLWHYVDKVVEGPLGMLMLMTALYWFGLVVFFGHLRLPLYAKAPLLVLVGFFPPVLSILGEIWKDTLMQACLLAGLGALLIYRARPRWPWLLFIVPVFFVATTVRHNGILAALPLFALLPYFAPALERRGRWVRLGAALLIAALSLFALRKLGEAITAPYTERTEYWQTVFNYDLAGISVETGDIVIDPETGILRPGATIRDVRSVYSTTEHLDLYHCPRRQRRCTPVFVTVTEPQQLHAIVRNWVRAVREHPGAYVRHRAAVASHLLGLTSFRPKPLPGRPNAAIPDDAGFWKRAQIRTLNWIHVLARSPLFKVWIYVVLELCFFVLAVVRFVRGHSPIPALIAASGLGYMGTFLLTTGAPDFRYSVWTILTLPLALLALYLRREPEALRATTSAASTPEATLEPGDLSTTATAAEKALAIAAPTRR